jgi:hypothetical protein
MQQTLEVVVYTLSSHMPIVSIQDALRQHPPAVPSVCPNKTQTTEKKAVYRSLTKKGRQKWSPEKKTSEGRAFNR